MYPDAKYRQGKWQEGRGEWRRSRDRRTRSEEPSNSQLVVDTLNEIRCRGDSSDSNKRLSCEEIDQLLSHIRRSRSESRDNVTTGRNGEDDLDFPSPNCKSNRTRASLHPEQLSGPFGPSQNYRPTPGHETEPMHLLDEAEEKQNMERMTEPRVFQDKNLPSVTTPLNNSENSCKVPEAFCEETKEKSNYSGADFNWKSNSVYIPAKNEADEKNEIINCSTSNPLSSMKLTENGPPTLSDKHNSSTAAGVPNVSEANQSTNYHNSSENSTLKIYEKRFGSSDVIEERGSIVDEDALCLVNNLRERLKQMTEALETVKAAADKINTRIEEDEAEASCFPPIHSKNTSRMGRPEQIKEDNNAAAKQCEFAFPDNVGYKGRLETERQAEERKEEGNQLYKLKDYREALRKYTEAIELFPTCAALYGNRSACYLMLGQPRQALEDAKTATAKDPTFTKGWSRVARCSVLFGDTISARQALDKVEGGETELRNVEVLERFNRDAQAAVSNRDYRKALYCIEKSLEVANYSSALRTSRAECLAFLGRYPEASEVANSVLQFDNLNADAIYVRGLCLYYEDNVDRAFSHFTQVLRLAPDHTKAKEIYRKAKALKQKKEEGNTAFKSGALEQAYTLYSEALDIDPFNRTTNAKLFFNRATVAAKQKKTVESIADCTKAIELDPTYIKPLLRRAKSYMETEQYEEAVRDYEAVFKTDKSNRDYRALLQEAKLELKKSKRKDYYKVLGVDKTANEEEIKKAYRKRAMVHHPDRHSGATEQEQKDHEQKFKEVGEAYAVLSDEKKRRMYDSGQDLEDGGGGGHGYHDVDPNTIFQAFFNGGGHPGMGGHHFSFGGGNPSAQSFSFQFG